MKVLVMIQFNPGIDGSTTIDMRGPKPVEVPAPADFDSEVLWKFMELDMIPDVLHLGSIDNRAYIKGETTFREASTIPWKDEAPFYTVDVVPDDGAPIAALLEEGWQTDDF